MTLQSDTSTSPEQRAGHHWKEADRAKEFVERTDREAAERAEIQGVLVSLLPFDRGAAIRVLDIGSGHGVLAASILDALPNARAVGLDVSEAMMEIGRERMARFGDRFEYHVGDFADGVLPASLQGTFDLAVSSRAIHHLPPDGKRTLYADIRNRLHDGGCFFNIDNMRPRDEFFRDLYRNLRRAEQGDAPPQAAERQPSGREYPDPVEDQLVWLKEAGFSHVECVWRRLGRSMTAAFK